MVNPRCYFALLMIALVAVFGCPATAAAMKCNPPSLDDLIKTGIVAEVDVPYPSLINYSRAFDRYEDVPDFVAFSVDSQFTKRLRVFRALSDTPGLEKGDSVEAEWTYGWSTSPFPYGERLSVRLRHGHLTKWIAHISSCDAYY